LKSCAKRFAVRLQVPQNESIAKAKLKRKYYLLFIRPSATFTLAVFNRCPMQHSSAFGLSCLERDRLADELGEAQTRGRNLTRLRKLTLAERVSLEQRENLAQARLRNHVAEHGCQS
jgi:hypothetical protein